MDKDIKVLTLSGLTHYDEKLKEYIDSINKSVPENIRYVACTGEHDEVAIQEALTAVGELGVGTVYVCGKQCVLSNEGVTQVANTSKQATAVINVPMGVTLDFENVSAVSFCNDEPKAAQILFSVANGATLRYCNLHHTNMSANEGVKNPRVLRTGQASIIEFCDFSEIVTPNQNTTEVSFYLGDYAIWRESDIMNMTVSRQNAAIISTGKDVTLDNVEVKFVYGIKGATLISAGQGTKINRFTYVNDDNTVYSDTFYVEASKNCTITKSSFEYCAPILNFTTTATVKEVEFIRCTSYGRTINCGNVGTVTGNIFKDLEVYDDAYGIIICGSGSRINNNKFNSFDIPDTYDGDEWWLIKTGGGSEVKDNFVAFGAASSSTVPATLVNAASSSDTVIAAGNVVCNMPSGSNIKGANVVAANNFVNGALV